MELREATAADADAIAAVGTETWHDTYDDIMGPETVADLTDDWYDPGTVAGYFDDDSFRAHVAETDGVVVGYAYSRPDPDDESLWHLPALYVLPERQGDGLGARLLDRVETDARDAAAETVRLVVLAANDSRAFYEHHGYEQVDERDEEITGTRELVYERLI